MEWMLQLADEIDDALGIIRFGWLRVNGRFRAVVRTLGPAAPAAVSAPVPLEAGKLPRIL